ncbi:branched-chain amino acid ABC transporter permease [Parasphaerochaeta coccoides]|uniref:Inner-membrane translocator n=1 Tax=Parasphaerochaeta coccoides (strain ATCC BAA-1237 / DSM 17374 / SPN1) TaxID=760011 RepID=F4GJN3_PARC1|nr:branched-chain amino acid ABC transporter permease [Parasphaerochaeta coccoides]AEC02780.1 inner-membrane translocator [Parasphaerochaeta coccoides DSM 17374]
MALLISILTSTLITLIAVIGIYILTGMTGLFSLGQASFMAIGAYTSGLLVVKWGLPFPLACLIAIFLAVLVGWIVGLPTVRLRRDYISLVTLGFGEAITAILNRATPLTGGAAGFVGIPPYTSFTLVLVSAVIIIAAVAMFKVSKFGRQCSALRGDELAARAVGINVPWIKMTAFLFSVAVTAYSGCLYAFYTTYVDPSIFGWRKSADWVIMVFFGGSGSLTGAVLATFILSGLPEILRFLADYRSIFYAALVLLIINFKPSGLLGSWELTPKNLRKLARDISLFMKKGGKNA